MHKVYGRNKMARLENLPAPMRKHLADLPCPVFETTPFVEPPAPGQRRVAMISTAGLHRRGDRPFSLGSEDYRVIPISDWFYGRTAAGKLLYAIKDKGIQSDDKYLKIVAGALIIPTAKSQVAGSD
jgi:hypothetical protein